MKTKGGEERNGKRKNKEGGRELPELMDRKQKFRVK
jgi:hypothetical protein